MMSESKMDDARPASVSSSASSSDAGGESQKAGYTLILHAMASCKVAPTPSPYVLKLATYLRIAGIKYEFDTKKPFGAKGKMPWITFNGENVDDSDIIIDFLNQKLKKNLWGNATKEEKGAARAFGMMMEAHLLLGLLDWRWVYGIDHIGKILTVSGMRLMAAKFFVKRKIKAALATNGFTLHTPQQRMTMIKKDLTALSDYLGRKAYFLGNEPTEIDATVFGVLGQFVYCAPGSPYDKIFEEEYKNLKDYCERMKAKFWPDWDSLCEK